MICIYVYMHVFPVPVPFLGNNLHKTRHVFGRDDEADKLRSFLNMVFTRAYRIDDIDDFIKWG